MCRQLCQGTIPLYLVGLERLDYKPTPQDYVKRAERRRKIRKARRNGEPDPCDLMPPPPPLYTSFPIKGESLSYPPESENLVSTPTSSPASFGVALSCWVGGLQQHSRKKDGLIHLHLNFMERDFSHSSVMERGPSNASEGVYLSLKGRLV